ncbi:unnamed protein product [Bubo scandiacus]
MGPPSYKQCTLMLPVQIHLSHFNSSSLILMLVVLMSFSGPTLGYMSKYMKYFYNRVLYLGINILPQWGIPCSLDHSMANGGAVFPPLGQLIPGVLDATGPVIATSEQPGGNMLAWMTAEIFLHAFQLTHG